MRLLWAWMAAALLACQSSSPDGAPAATTPAAALGSAGSAAVELPTSDPGAGYYLGRRIAPTMSHEAAGWLVRPEREAEESSARMLGELRLRPGDVACDLGAGNGFHTLEMAKRVAPTGRAIAVDIQPEMLTLLGERARAAHVTNVETVLGASADPKLADGSCDLVLMADVYHELDDPAGMLAHLRRALSARGVVVLLEFRSEDLEVPIKPEHKMSRAQILLELQTNGFALVRSYDELPWQHLMFFAVKKP